MLLPAVPIVSDRWRHRLERLAEQTRGDPPADLAVLIRTELGVDCTARYGGVPIPHPFGKASGQLSFTLPQVETDVAAGIGFVVLKTVIAESPDGGRSMEAWAVPESRMFVEERMAAEGRRGWTVTWKGRGWAGTLEEYLKFFRAAMEVARERDVPVIPSVKYHLPVEVGDVSLSEYEHTTAELLGVWADVGCGGPMLLEKDLSPTLAGDDRATHRATILAWLRNVTGWVSGDRGADVRLGVKVMNALFEDEFQVEMIEALMNADPAPSYLVVFNRLYDAHRRVAYGGWELSDRNLRALDRLRETGLSRLPLSATGNICSGRVMIEYAARGCESGQVHTFFQVPLTEYTADGGSRSARALHTLLLHPRKGLVVWLRHLSEVGRLDAGGGEVRFLDLVGSAQMAE